MIGLGLDPELVKDIAFWAIVVVVVLAVSVVVSYFEQGDDE